MNVSRAAAWGIGGALMAAWLAAAAGTRTVAPAMPAPIDRTPLLTMPPAIEQDAERLQKFLDAPPHARQTERNPFEFARRVPRLDVRAAEPTSIQPGLPIVPPGPKLTLDGIAEDASPNGQVRTAIISAAGQLYLVTEGGSVTTRYRVSRVGADAVELEDLLDGTQLRIGLK